MHNHNYGDLSNLNAPYDAVPLQGYGGLGADDPKYPWKEDSHDTLVLQQDLNEMLTAHGKCLLSEDSEMGPSTCGALKFAVQQGILSSGAVPSTCAAHANEGAPLPKSPPCASSSPSPSPAPQPSPDEEDELVKTGGGIPGWAIGLGLGVVAIAVAMMLKKKKR